MKTLTTALLAELALSVTRPGYLVELGYSTTLRLSTMGSISWGGYTWGGYDVAVSRISRDGTGAGAANLSVGNTDGTLGAIVLGQGAADIPCSIWAVYAGATASGDVVQVFSGVTDGAEITAQRVTFALAAQGNATLYAPRVFVNQINGFNWVKPAGTVFSIGIEKFVMPVKETSYGTPTK